MIYRIIGETERYRWEGEPYESKLVKVTGTLMGAMGADFGWPGWYDLKAPSLSNPRVRFWWTEAGWDRYGRDTLADAMQSGRVYRLLVRKNPPDSAVVYRDKWQVALLPVKRRRDEMP